MKLIKWLFGFFSKRKQIKEQVHELEIISTSPNFKHIPRYRSDAKYLDEREERRKQNHSLNFNEANDLADAMNMVLQFTDSSNDSDSGTTSITDNSSNGFDEGFSGGGFSGGGSSDSWDDNSSSSSSYDSGSSFDSSSSSDWGSSSSND